MLIHRTYTTKKQRGVIIHEFTEILGYTQVPTKGIFVGTGHLLFDDGKPEPPQPEPTLPPRDLEAEIDEMKVKDAHITTELDELKVELRAKGIIE